MLETLPFPPAFQLNPIAVNGTDHPLAAHSTTNKYHDQKQLMGERVYFGSPFQRDASPSSQEGIATSGRHGELTSLTTDRSDL